MTEKPGYEELEKLFNLSLDMLCVASLDGYFLLINSAFETTLGYSTQELTRMPIRRKKDE